MFTKVLAGVLSVGVIAIGAVIYTQYGMNDCHSGCPFSAKQPVATDASCCQTMSRAEVAHPCCEVETPAQEISLENAEQLTIEPREVK